MNPLPSEAERLKVLSGYVWQAKVGELRCSHHHGTRVLALRCADRFRRTGQWRNRGHGRSRAA